jgi:cysteine-rich repeat protein
LKDTCSQICGDGIIIGNRPSANYCDDGNLSNYDGCSDQCQVETGFTCSGANSTMPDTCTEICGDGRNFGFLQCDDGNLISGDGCSANCTIEKGFACQGGTKTTPDTCFEICADGLNFG